MNHNKTWYHDNYDSKSISKSSSSSNKPAFSSAREIFEFLEPRVWKQTTAKKAAAILMENTLHGRRQNILFCGPSGCGKTHIWRILAKEFPDMIEIADASLFTQEGFKGGTKWCSVLGQRKYTDNTPRILVLDEIDKLIAPRFSGNNDNISEALMSEGLKIIEGTILNCKDQNGEFKVDTSYISFVFCGAFSNKAREIADEHTKSTFGFCSEPIEVVSAYSVPITVADIIEFGAMPEFMGRIEQVINLEPMDISDYYDLLINSDYGPVRELEELYDARIRICPETGHKLAKDAIEQNLGVRGIRNALRTRIDLIRFENESQSEFEL